jgi:hypothetical protein
MSKDLGTVQLMALPGGRNHGHFPQMWLFSKAE